MIVFVDITKSRFREIKHHTRRRWLLDGRIGQHLIPADPNDACFRIVGRAYLGDELWLGRFNSWFLGFFNGLGVGCTPDKHEQ